MGKVKPLYRFDYSIGYNKYQFPMGKVKASDINGITGFMYGCVSIPYGKGKAELFLRLRGIMNRINSLWER